MEKIRQAPRRLPDLLCIIKQAETQEIMSDFRFAKRIFQENAKYQGIC